MFVNFVLDSRGKMYVCDYSCWPIRTAVRPFQAKTLMQRFLETLYYYYVSYYYMCVIICTVYYYYNIIIMYYYRFFETLYYVIERAELCVMFQSIVHGQILIDVALY